MIVGKKIEDRLPYGSSWQIKRNVMQKNMIYHTMQIHFIIITTFMTSLKIYEMPSIQIKKRY